MPAHGRGLGALMCPDGDQWALPSSGCQCPTPWNSLLVSCCFISPGFRSLNIFENGFLLYILLRLCPQFLMASSSPTFSDIMSKSGHPRYLNTFCGIPPWVHSFFSRLWESPLRVMQALLLRRLESSGEDKPAVLILWDKCCDRCRRGREKPRTGRERT